MTTTIIVSHSNPNADHAIVVTNEAGSEQRIEPGQSAGFHVYTGNDLHITEVALETAHEPVTLQSFSLGAIGQGVTGDEPTEHPAADATVHNLNTTDSLEGSVETKTFPDGTVLTGIEAQEGFAVVEPVAADAVAPHADSISAADAGVMPADLAAGQSTQAAE